MYMAGEVCILSLDLRDVAKKTLSWLINEPSQLFWPLHLKEVPRRGGAVAS